MSHYDIKRVPFTIYGAKFETGLEIFYIDALKAIGIKDVGEFLTEELQLQGGWIDGVSMINQQHCIIIKALQQKLLIK